MSPKRRSQRLDDRTVELLRRVAGDLLKRVDRADPDVDLVITLAQLLDRPAEAFVDLSSAAELKAAQVLALTFPEVEKADHTPDQNG
jgi:hypothetical protein